MISIRWLGVTTLALRLAKAARGATAQQLGSGLYAEANAILAKAIPLTPIDTGNLRASGHVTLPKVSGDSVEVEIGFGGAAAGYAIYVHERMDAAHAAPTQAKFLEQPVLEAQPGLAERLGARIDLRI